MDFAGLEIMIWLRQFDYNFLSADNDPGLGLLCSWIFCKKMTDFLQIGTDCSWFAFQPGGKYF